MKTMTPMMMCDSTEALDADLGLLMLEIEGDVDRPVGADVQHVLRDGWLAQSRSNLLSCEVPACPAYAK